MYRSNDNNKKSPQCCHFPNVLMAKRSMIFMKFCMVFAFIISMARPLNASAVASSRRPSLSTSQEGAASPTTHTQTFPFHNILPSASTSAASSRRRPPLALLHKRKQKEATESSSSSSLSSSLSPTATTASSTSTTGITVSSSTASASKLGALAAYFDASLVPQSDCDIDTQRFLEACRQLESFMVSVGHKQSAKDLLQNIKKIEGACAKTSPELRQTLLDLLQHEKNTGIHDGLSKSLPTVRILDEQSGAMGLLWIRRSLAFQHAMYSLVLDDPDMDGDDFLDQQENNINTDTLNDHQVAAPVSMTTRPMHHSTDDYSLWLLGMTRKASKRTLPRRSIIRMASTGTEASTTFRSTQLVTATRTAPTKSSHSSTSRRFKCPAEAAQVAYSRILEPHHGWALRNIYAVALKSTTPPTRRDLLAELGGFQLSSSSLTSEKERQQLAIAENDLRLLVTSWEPILDRCRKTFEMVDLDDTRRI